jgi:uncharacterized RDD family membrane protein YckC
MQTAGFLRRVLALIYDSLVIVGIVLFLTLVLVLFNGSYAESGSFASFLQFFILIFSGPIFYSYFWLNKGQTIGMQAWKIRLISINETKLNAKQTFIRCLISVISFLFFGIGYFWILYDKNNLSWSDIVTKTKIVKIDE